MSWFKTPLTRNDFSLQQPSQEGAYFKIKVRWSKIREFWVFLVTSWISNNYIISCFLSHKITMKSTAIWLISPCDLSHFTLQSEADDTTNYSILPTKMTGNTKLEGWKHQDKTMKTENKMLFPTFYSLFCNFQKTRFLTN